MIILAVENYGATITSAAARAKVYRLESVLLAMPQVNCPVHNMFAAGLYAREMTIPAGTVITGAVHKTQHITVISKGRIRVMSPDGGTVELAAPAMFISEPGVKNAGLALEDTVWTTFHANPDDEENMDVLVERLSTSKNSELLGNRQLSHEVTKLEGK